MIPRVPLSERGVALALAIFALVVVGALAAAGFIAAVQEQRIAQSTYDRQNALGAAEVAIAGRLREWPRDSVVDGSDVHRLSEDLFLIDVTGTARRNTIRRIGLLVQLAVDADSVDLCPPPTAGEPWTPKCATDRALHAAAQVKPLRSRAWIELYNWP